MRLQEALYRKHYWFHKYSPTPNIIVVIVVIIETYFAGEDKYSPTPNIIVVIIETYSAGEDKKLLRVSPLPTKKRNLKKS